MSARSLHLKQRLARGETTFGAWLSISNPNIAEIMAGTGYDWVLIDAEHGPFGLEGLQVALMAFKGSATVPIVRVAWNDPVRIKQTLDIGADGILVPMVNAASEARAAVAACNPPEGVRGFGPKRAADYGRNVDDYTAQANAGLITIVQIEHVDAVAAIDEILAVPGIDAICIGPTDLSGSAGVLRQFGHPTVQRALETIVARSRARGLPVCMGVVFEPEAMARWCAKGATFVLTGEDTSLLRTAATDALGRTRAAVAGNAMSAGAETRREDFAASEATLDDALADEIAGDVGAAAPAWRRILAHRDTAIVLVAAALFVFFALTAHRFLAAYTMMELARRASILGILAVGMTFLFVAGELDLSIGSHYSFLLILMSYQNERLGLNPGVAALVVIVIGLLIGALNGVLVTRVGLPSFITTLGMLALLRGATNVVSSGYPIPAKNTALPFYQVIRANLPGTHLPNMFAAMLVVVLIGGIVLATTRFGSHVYATGGNVSAARNAGIDVSRVKFRCFVAMGGLCALAAIILFGRVGLAPLNAGNGLELQVIAAIIIGGVGLYGGRGDILGSTVGVLILCMITSGLILLGVAAYWDGVATGAMILLAVGANLALQRRAAQPRK